jgi:hypothetical protein
MSRRKLGVTAAALVAGALAMPATSGAQTDVGQLCHSLLGSGTTDLTVVSVDRCLASSETTCTLSDEIDVLGLVTIRHGVCLDVAGVLEEPVVTVRGVATVRVLP